MRQFPQIFLHSYEVEILATLKGGLETKNVKMNKFQQ